MVDDRKLTKIQAKHASPPRVPPLDQASSSNDGAKPKSINRMNRKNAKTKRGKLERPHEVEKPHGAEKLEEVGKGSIEKGEDLKKVKSFQLDAKKCKDLLKAIDEYESELKKNPLPPAPTLTYNESRRASAALNQSKLPLNYWPAIDPAVSETLMEYFEENSTILREYSMIRDCNESKTFLRTHIDLICDQGVAFLFFWYLELLIEKKRALMPQVARQYLYMQAIFEHSNDHSCNPRISIRVISRKFFGELDQLDVCVKDFMNAVNTTLAENKQLLNTRPLKRKNFENLPDGLKFMYMLPVYQYLSTKF